MPTSITLVRHGAVENPGKILYGRLPGYPLSEVGLHQAKAAGQMLRDLDFSAVFVSPQLRTQQTVAVLAEGRAVTPVISSLIDEVRCFLEGESLDAAAAREWDIYTGAPPGFEQPEDVIRRARSFFALVLAQHPGENILAVTHGDVIAFSALWAFGLPITPMGKQKLRGSSMPDDYPDLASATTLQFDSGLAEELPSIVYRRAPLG